jgi:hypothetical protein
VKKFGEMSLAGIVYGNPSNQCWPMPMLFIYKQGTVRIIQQPDKVLLIYTGPSTDVRRVRLNDRHPEPLTPSWYGDSVGYYEGDTLVVDTGLRLFVRRPGGLRTTPQLGAGRPLGGSPRGEALPFRPISGRKSGRTVDGRSRS